MNIGIQYVSESTSNHQTHVHKLLVVRPNMPGHSLRNCTLIFICCTTPHDDASKIHPPSRSGPVWPHYPATRLYVHQTCFHSTCTATTRSLPATSTPNSGSLWNANFATTEILGHNLRNMYFRASTAQPLLCRLSVDPGRGPSSNFCLDFCLESSRSMCCRALPRTRNYASVRLPRFQSSGPHRHSFQGPWLSHGRPWAQQQASQRHHRGHAQEWVWSQQRCGKTPPG